jgi:hypothetical protein
MFLQGANTEKFYSVTLLWWREGGRKGTESETEMQITWNGEMLRRKRRQKRIMEGLWEEGIFSIRNSGQPCQFLQGDQGSRERSQNLRDWSLLMTGNDQKKVKLCSK